MAEETENRQEELLTEELKEAKAEAEWTEENYMEDFYPPEAIGAAYSALSAVDGLEGELYKIAGDADYEQLVREIKGFAIEIIHTSLKTIRDTLIPADEPDQS